MSVRAIVSYDDTENDHDALMLGRVLADAGAQLTLAYVRHSTQDDPTREQLEEHEAEALLERGAKLLGDVPCQRRVVVSASTGDGLRWLAEHEEADVIVFGSEYRTPAGHIAPQRSAQSLLEGGSTAVAIAPANYRLSHPFVRTIGILAEPGDDATIATARELADQLGATLTRDDHHVDLLIVGSRWEAREGHVLLASHTQHAVEEARVPVLVLARGVPLVFGAPLFVS
jgi:nucleotide-binding universal stress UspA family protein